jgi:hypothetical protein
MGTRKAFQSLTDCILKRFLYVSTFSQQFDEVFGVIEKVGHLLLW